MTAARFQVLGPFAVLVGGAPVELSSRKHRALLAVLALSAGRVLSVDHLVDALWGEQPPPTARHALQVHISQLRKLLGQDVLGTERPGYVLRVPPDCVDVHEFASLSAQGRRALGAGQAAPASALLTRALELWRGPALADLLAEPFAAGEAPRLEALRLVVIEERVTADLGLGRHAELVGELESLVARHPLREPLWGLLILAAYRAGRQAEALEAYAGLRDRLRDDLGLDPSRELQALEAAVLRQDPALAAPPTAPRATTAPVHPERGPSGAQESRRVATVLALALTGLDEVSGTADPEDLSALLTQCVGLVREAVTRYGGSIEQALGGELIAVFGAPVAHEDDPERAVRAAVDLRDSAGQRPDLWSGLGLRMGISTGEVLLAAAPTRGDERDRRLSVVGEVVHEARRLQGHAGTDIAVAASTQAATRTRVRYRALEDAAGAAGAVVDIVDIVDIAPVGRLPQQVVGPFVGRECEQSLLGEAWALTVGARSPRVVSVLGEAGVGKSRLLAELGQQIGAGGTVLTGRCLPYGEALSYAPLADVLRQAAGATPGDSRATARGLLDALVRTLPAPVAGDVEVGRHLALLTGLDDDQDRERGLVDERTLHLSARHFLEAMARRGPLCVVLDDVHWADDALLDLVLSLGRRISGVPLMLVTLARPELVERRADWGRGLPVFVPVPLAPLSLDSTRELVAALGQAHVLPVGVLADLADRSGGNPLFAEELVATCAESGSAAGVPASLASLLLARLDALPPDQQRVLRSASVLGTTFWSGGVSALDGAVPSSPGVLQNVLVDLEERGLLREDAVSTLAGEVAYSFKHVLLRDAAYGSLSRRQRALLHGSAESWLSSAAGERVADFADQLAHHAAAAGQPERALEHLTTAADRSRRAAAHQREASLLSDAVTLAAGLGQPGLVGELQARRGRALARLALWAQARGALERALQDLPADSDESLHRRAEVHCDLSAACFWLLDTDSIRTHAQAALDLGLQIGSHDVQLAARAQITSADSATGDVQSVLVEGRSLIADAGEWGAAVPYERLGGFSLQLYLTGNGSSAIEVSRAAVATGRSAGDTQGVLWNMPHIGMAAAAEGRYDEALAVFAEARRFGEEYELQAGMPRAIAMSAGMHLDLFDYVGAEEIQQEARELGRTWFNPSAVSAGIDLLFNLVRRGDVGAAQRLVDGIGDEVATGGGWHGWLWKLRFTQARAELAGAVGDTSTAIDLAREALALSQAKRRTKYEAYARLTLGQQWQSLGNTTEAVAELTAATELARGLENPALQVMTGAGLVGATPPGSAERTAAAQTAKNAADRVLATLTVPVLRERFAQAAAVQTVRTLS